MGKLINKTKIERWFVSELYKVQNGGGEGEKEGEGSFCRRRYNGGGAGDELIFFILLCLRFMQRRKCLCSWVSPFDDGEGIPVNVGPNSSFQRWRQTGWSQAIDWLVREGFRKRKNRSYIRRTTIRLGLYGYTVADHMCSISFFFFIIFFLLFDFLKEFSRYYFVVIFSSRFAHPVLFFHISFLR